MRERVLVSAARGLHYLAPLLRMEMGRVGTERARQTVTKSIKMVLDRLRKLHPALADHLAASIRRGYRCCYLPEPPGAAPWQVCVPSNGGLGSSRERDD
jgi:hypothetical protein